MSRFGDERRSKVIVARREKAGTRWEDAGRCDAAEFQLLREFKDDTAAVIAVVARSRSPVVGRAVEIAVRVEDHFALRYAAITAIKVVKVGVGPAAAPGCQLENSTAAVWAAAGAAEARRAVEIAGRIHIETACRSVSVKHVGRAERPVPLEGESSKIVPPPPTPPSSGSAV